MPRKIKELIRELEKAGFINRGGKGSHRNYLHPRGVKLTISGKPGSDAKRYQEKQVAEKIREVRNEAE
jgi:predicted RNA binding protein YcfA (HicA-like mRNA interferase family)